MPFTRARRWIARERAAPPTPARAAPDLSRPDISAADARIVSTVWPFTMTGVERLLAAIDAARHVARHRIPGDIVECGVWRGGSTMAMALALQAESDTSRRLYLYDTFEGMPPPTDADRSHDGATAEAQLNDPATAAAVLCRAGEADVRANLATTAYPAANIICVPGLVEQTIPAVSPTQIAILRLDTDWYESTLHELVHLYPLLSPGGLLIIDDYGHWRGARQAVDEYRTAHAPELFLHRIDYTGRIAIKP